MSQYSAVTQPTGPWGRAAGTALPEVPLHQAIMTISGPLTIGHSQRADGATKEGTLTTARTTTPAAGLPPCTAQTQPLPPLSNDAKQVIAASAQQCQPCPSSPWSLVAPAPAPASILADLDPHTTGKSSINAQLRKAGDDCCGIKTLAPLHKRAKLASPFELPAAPRADAARADRARNPFAWASPEQVHLEEPTARAAPALLSLAATGPMPFDHHWAVAAGSIPAAPRAARRLFANSAWAAHPAPLTRFGGEAIARRITLASLPSEPELPGLISPIEGHDDILEFSDDNEEAVDVTEDCEGSRVGSHRRPRAAMASEDVAEAAALPRPPAWMMIPSATGSAGTPTSRPRASRGQRPWASRAFFAPTVPVPAPATASAIPEGVQDLGMGLLVQLRPVSVPRNVGNW